MSTCESVQHMLAATKHLLKAIEADNNLNDDIKRAVMEFDTHLSKMLNINDSAGDGFEDLVEQLKCAEKKIMRWESSPSVIYDSGTGEVSNYLQAVDQIQAIIRSIGDHSMYRNRNRMELSNKAQYLLQIAMSRLKLEVYQVIVLHKKYLEPQHMSFRTGNAIIFDDSSLVSPEEEEIAEERASTTRQSMEYSVELIDPRVIDYLQSIALVMYGSGYGNEFCDAFIGIREAAIDEHLTNLEIEKLSIVEVLKLDWDSWNSKIKKWIRAMKIMIQVYLSSEKRLCDQILSDLGMNSRCFAEIAKASVLCLINFGQAIAIGPRKPENLICLLDMYEILADLVPQIDVLFLGEGSSFIQGEFQYLLKILGDSSRVTFLKLGDMIVSYAPKQPIPAGKFHPLTTYTMNYIRHLTMYHETINKLLVDDSVDDPNIALEMDTNPHQMIPSLTAHHLRSIASKLESNLIEISKLYKEESLQYIFLSNNMHYIVQKVKGNDLRPFFGDEWIRRHNGKLQQYTNSYVRASWSSVVSFLRNNGKSCKDQVKRFYCAFDDLYKNQKNWCIPDVELREDLQIKISQQVIPPYRSFLTSNEIDDKYIKYSVEDLEKLLLDLFLGLPHTLTHRNSRRH